MYITSNYCALKSHGKTAGSYDHFPFIWKGTIVQII